MVKEKTPLSEREIKALQKELREDLGNESDVRVVEEKHARVSKELEGAKARLDEAFKEAEARDFKDGSRERFEAEQGFVDLARSKLKALKERVSVLKSLPSEPLVKKTAPGNILGKTFEFLSSQVVREKPFVRTSKGRFPLRESEWEKEYAARKGDVVNSSVVTRHLGALQEYQNSIRLLREAEPKSYRDAFKALYGGDKGTPSTRSYGFLDVPDDVLAKLWVETPKPYRNAVISDYLLAQFSSINARHYRQRFFGDKASQKIKQQRLRFQERVTPVGRLGALKRDNPELFKALLGAAYSKTIQDFKSSASEKILGVIKGQRLPLLSKDRFAPTQVLAFDARHSNPSLKSVQDKSLSKGYVWRGSWNERKRINFKDESTRLREHLAGVGRKGFMAARQSNLTDLKVFRDFDSCLDKGLSVEGAAFEALKRNRQPFRARVGKKRVEVPVKNAVDLKRALKMARENPNALLPALKPKPSSKRKRAPNQASIHDFKRGRARKR